MMDSLRKSFKSHGSYRQSNRPSEVGSLEHNYDEQPILFDHEDHAMKSPNSIGSKNEVVVKIDGNRDFDELAQASGSNIWNGSSYDFWKDKGLSEEKGNTRKSENGFHFHQPGVQGVDNDSPLPKVAGKVQNKKKASDQMSLDMDVEMDALRIDKNLPPLPEKPINQQASSKELRVSFNGNCPTQIEIVPEPVRRRHTELSEDDRLHQQQNRASANLDGSNGGAGDRGEVLRCTSNASFKRTSSLLRTKTRSRLMDPPEEPDRRSDRISKSGQLKSGLLGKPNDEEEEDPFAEEDFPEEFKKACLSPLNVLQWVSLILILAALICSLSIPALKKTTLWNLHLWKWEVLVLILICGRLVSGWAIRIAVFFIERNFLLRKRVLYFVYGVRRAVQNCFWLIQVLIIWHFMFDKKVGIDTMSKTVSYVSKILFCLLLGTVIWLIKTLLVKVLASSFHVSTYFDRIQESLFNQYVIETLSGPPLVEIQNIQEEEEQVMAEVRKLQNAGATVPGDLRPMAFPGCKSGKVIGNVGLQGSYSKNIGKSVRFPDSVINKQQDEGITIDHLHKLNQNNISAWNMKRLMNIVRHGVLSTLDEQIVGTSYEDDPATQIRSEKEAKVAGRKIFKNVTKPGSKYIYLEDLKRFLREDESMKTLSLFDGATESKKISKSALKNWVVNAFRERRALSLTLNDTKTAVNKLHQMANVIVVIIITVISLLILGIATTRILVVISSQLLVTVFVFGNTCKIVFEAIIFLFVMHPFDVGDRCEVDGVQMVVEEMNILTTVFLRYDNQKLIFPNSVLSTKCIGNYYRSPDMGDGIEFWIHIATPAEKIAIMKQRILGHINSKKDHWYPGPMMVLKDMDQLKRIKMAVWFQHRINHQDMGEKWSRRSQLIEEMVKIFKELDIEYRLYPLDINVRNMPTLSSNRLPSSWTTPSTN